MLVRIQRDRPLRPAVEAPVALLIAGDAFGGDAGAGDGLFGYAALGIDVDLSNVAGFWHLSLLSILLLFAGAALHTLS